MSKKTIDVQIGPTSKYSAMIAPAFHGTQVNICRSLKAYSMHYNRTAIKVWLIAYCCISTSTRYIKFMDDITHSHSVTHQIHQILLLVWLPKFLTNDGGSQLVKGCQTIQFCFKDIKRKFQKTHGGRI